MAEKTKVDFALRSDVEGNLFKLTNNNISASDHLFLSNFLTGLKMFPGKNRLYPDHGFAHRLYEIGSSFESRETVFSMIFRLQEDMTQHYGKNIVITPTFSEDSSHITLDFDLGELPGKVKTEIRTSRSGVKTIESKYFQ